MTRDPITDPEILADLRLRDRTARERADRRGPYGLDVGQDPDGLSPAIAALYASAPDPDVEHWPCRKGCGRMVGVTSAGIEAFESCNRKLKAMRQDPIGKHQVMWCPDCKRVDDEMAALQRGPRGPGSQTEIAGAGPPEQRPSWMPTPRAERNRRRNSR